MSSNVLALIIVTIVFNNNAYGSFDTRESSVNNNYEQLQDNSIFKWTDLRNEVRQGDAITYELGEPQYQILNADEPIEIITADQPGYYEDLKRYEQAAELEEINDEREVGAKVESTTVLPKEQEDKQENKISNKIKFVITKSNKINKDDKLYLDMSKYQKEQLKKACVDKINASANQINANENSIRIDEPQINLTAKDDMPTIAEKEPETKSDEGQNTIQKIKLKYINPQQYMKTTERPLKLEEDVAVDHSTEARTEVNVTSTTTESTIVQDPTNAPVINSMGASLNSSPPLFLALGTQMSDMMPSSAKGDSEMTYKVVPKQLPATPPHIRVFE